MDIILERCCRLDVHKKSVVACVITPEGRETRRFGTTTSRLLELGDWLQAQGVTQVAMESTSVYWKPVYNILEDEFTVMVVNAAHIKAVRGGRPTSKACPVLDTGTPSGLPSCSSMACCGPVSSRTGPSGNCGS